MKATLEFNLPEEQEEHQTAIDAQKWKSLMVDFLQEYRNRLKYGSLSKDATEQIEEIRAWIFERMETDNLSTF